MKKVIRLTESQIRNMVRESIRRSLTERVTDLPGWKGKLDWNKKPYNDKSLVSVKLLQKPGMMSGKENDNAKFLISVNGAPFATAEARPKRAYGAKNWEYFRTNEEFTELIISLGSRLPRGYSKNPRGPIGLGNIQTTDLNYDAALKAIKSIPDFRFTQMNEPYIWNKRSQESSNTIWLENTSDTRFTLESIPYALKAFVQGLLTPRNEGEKMHSVSDFENPGEYTEMNSKDAWAKALEIYKDYGKYYGLDHPRTYRNIEDCLNDYAEIIDREDREAANEPEDWYERNEHGDFDNY